MSLALTALQRIHQSNMVGAIAGTLKPTATRSVWSYTTDDAAATVETANYFNGAVKQLAVGDTIQAVMAYSGTPVLKHYVVTANNGAAVTVALQQATAG